MCNSTLRNRQAIPDLAVAAAKLGVDRAISALLAGDTVDRIGVVIVLLEEALSAPSTAGETTEDGFITRRRVKGNRLIRIT